MATEQFDAVLAEMRDLFAHDQRYQDLLGERFDRLAAAHAAEVAERDSRIERLFAANEQVMDRAEAAERLYAEIEPMYQQQGLNIVRLQKEKEAAERDARRYRRLRESGLEIAWNAQVSYSPGYHGADAQLMDAAIDACIGGGEG